MRDYELMVILDGSLEERDVRTAIDQYLGSLTARGGKVANLDHWGKRRFSYEIRHKTEMRHLNEGYYAVARLEATPEMTEELSRVLGLADPVIRHKIVRLAA
jgi:small subunit ribosomal protein S6